MRFAALHSTDLLAYNQLYLAVPLGLSQTAAPARNVAIVFAWVSLLTLALQIPVAAAATRLGPCAALRTAYLLHAFGFAGVATAAFVTLSDGAATHTTDQPAPLWLALASATCFGLGHLLAGPTALEAVSHIAAPTRTGLYFGLLATAGGVAVLVSSVAAGSLSDAMPQHLMWVPWAALGIAPLTAAAAAPRLLRRAIAAARADPLGTLGPL